jgi:hypothetical protein
MARHMNHHTRLTPVSTAHISARSEFASRVRPVAASLLGRPADTPTRRDKD